MPSPQSVDDLYLDLVPRSLQSKINGRWLWVHGVLDCCLCLNIACEIFPRPSRRYRRACRNFHQPEESASGYLG